MRYPEPVGYVNDFANVISPEYEIKIESVIREVKNKTSVEIAVVTIPSTEGEDIQPYSVELYTKWGIGKKGKDNGVLILVAINDRKAWITTGYGLEGILPDGLTGSIYRNYMRPAFREGKYGEGIYGAVLSIASTIAKSYGVKLSPKTPLTYGIQRKPRSPSIFGIFFPLLFFILIFGIRLGPLLFLGTRGAYWSGGPFGGSGGFGGGFGGFGGGATGGGGAGGSW